MQESGVKSRWVLFFAAMTSFNLEEMMMAGKLGMASVELDVVPGLMKMMMIMVEVAGSSCEKEREFKSYVLSFGEGRGSLRRRGMAGDSYGDHWEI